MDQGRIIVITGSPGTGKTTTASTVAKENVDKLLGILLTASKELKRSLAPTGNLYR